MPQKTRINNKLNQAFQEFHKSNPEVYQYFRWFAFEAIISGRKRFSAYLIANRIRWETQVVAGDVKFKINNNHIAFYARMFTQEFPEHSDLFELRALRAE